MPDMPSMGRETNILVSYNESKKIHRSAQDTQKIRPADDKVIQPDKPIRPIVWLNITIGVVVGLLLSLAYVFLADFYDHTVKSIDDVERYLGVPVLASNIGGVPDLIAPGTTGRLCDPDQPESFREAVATLLTDQESAQHLAATAKTTSHSRLNEGGAATTAVKM